MRHLLFFAAITTAQKRSKKCRMVEPLPPIRERHDLGGMLRERGLTGHGVELGVRDGRFLFASRAAAGSRCQGVYPLFLRAERRESARRCAGPILLVRSRLVVVRERAADRKDYDPHVEATQHASLGSRHGGE